MSSPSSLSLSLSTLLWVRAQGQVVYGQHTWYSISSTIHTPRRGQNHFGHIWTFLFVFLRSCFFFPFFFLHFIWFKLRFGFVFFRFLCAVSIYEYVWILLMKCSAKCTRLLNLFDFKFIVAPSLSRTLSVPLYFWRLPPRCSSLTPRLRVQVEVQALKSSANCLEMFD